ncbi:hypothetical protein THF1C08_130131 [Vibrio jasicida]|uniref:Uncharacterized protein n=1 Tax=Vibrio jasicida TaxID=766224 RepID=A0AAU9QGD8_9VIBR|nr:hypothetical protein THF1C08_130131 [Vibrio jasicida]CAH1573597.1 hypothetical protein THF1A12_120128 [Vibrio jasicida]
MNVRISNGSNKVCFNSTIKTNTLIEKPNYEKHCYRYYRCTCYRSYCCNG